MDGDAEGQKPAHDYDGIIVKNSCQTIVDVYITKFEEFQEKVENLF